mmetsp:Transcript_3038/g.8005  ORF Transcript_3038/g.8005 Transcript_3038/m.8005 type:complete len:312 (-) Transcript_3038:125-1060(-)
MNCDTSSSMSVMPVASWIFWNASSYECTFSMFAWMDALSLAIPQFARRTWRLSCCSSSSVSWPRSSESGTAFASNRACRSRDMASCTLRSSSSVSPSAFHSASNSRCSRSDVWRTRAAEACNLSRSSYATLAASITSAIERFFSPSSRWSFLYSESKTRRSRRRLSICSRSSLLCAIDSLNLTSALSSLFSSTCTWRSTAASASVGAWMPPMAWRWRRSCSRSCSFCLSSCVPRCRSSSIRRANWSPRSVILLICEESRTSPPIAATRVSSESSCFSERFSFWSFSMCDFCFFSTFCTSSAYALRSPSMIL